MNHLIYLGLSSSSYRYICREAGLLEGLLPLPQAFFFFVLFCLILYFFVFAVASTEPSSAFVASIAFAAGFSVCLAELLADCLRILQQRHLLVVGAFAGLEGVLLLFPSRGSESSCRP